MKGPNLSFCWVHLGFELGPFGFVLSPLGFILVLWDFCWVHLGFELGPFGFVLSPLGLALGLLGFTFGLRGILDTNMLVWATRDARVGWLDQCKSPMRMGFAFWLNIYASSKVGIPHTDESRRLELQNGRLVVL